MAPYLFVITRPAHPSRTSSRAASCSPVGWPSRVKLWLWAMLSCTSRLRSAPCRARDRSGGLAGPVIQQQLSRFAAAMVDAHAAGQTRPPFWSVTGRAVGTKSCAAGMLSEPLAPLIVARDHGFTTWSSVAGESEPTFELAVDAVVHGRIDELRAMLTDHADLPVRRSACGHRATLLHYTAANGVEIRRQMVPANAAEHCCRAARCRRGPLCQAPRVRRGV